MLYASSSSSSAASLNAVTKVQRLPWFFIVCTALLASVGGVMLYSAAGGKMDPWASDHLLRYGMALVVMLLVALTNLHVWIGIAYAVYGVALVLLIGVEVMGVVGMGAQRWIDLGLIRLQPSEIMKIALILALARYFHGATGDEMRRLSFLLPAFLMVLIPVALVLKQPDLGTALLILASAVVLFFMAGLPAWIFVAGGMGGLICLPIVWQFLRDYQKQRIYTFLDPSSDPRGAGFHIIQSKIAVGSGGTTGKGFGQGTQSQLNFLPEKQTDFIFTMFAEEFGFRGAILLLLLCFVMLVMGLRMALRAENQFSRLLAMGCITNFFFYIMINVGMVIGLFPVVGVPFPLVSYGGTAMLTVMVGFGLVANAAVHRDVRLGRGFI